MVRDLLAELLSTARDRAAEAANQAQPVTRIAAKTLFYLSDPEGAGHAHRVQRELESLRESISYSTYERALLSAAGSEAIRQEITEYVLDRLVWLEQQRDPGDPPKQPWPAFGVVIVLALFVGVVWLVSFLILLIVSIFAETVAELLFAVGTVVAILFVFAPLVEPITYPFRLSSYRRRKSLQDQVTIAAKAFRSELDGLARG